MRKISRERRQVVVLAASVAAMSGVGPALGRWHPGAEWLWVGVQMAVLGTAVVKMWRLGRRGGCCE